MRAILFATLVAVLAVGVQADEKEPKKKEEAKKVENPAPQFTLKDLDGKEHSLAQYKGKWIVLEWINHGCPFVKKHYDAGTMQALQKKYREKGVVWLSICSSAPGKQGHHEPAEWKKINAEKKGAADAVLLDPDGKVGKKYGAKVTPHMFVIDPKGGIAYQGAIDDEKRAFGKEAIEKANNYVAAALDAGLAGKKPEVAKTRPYG